MLTVNLIRSQKASQTTSRLTQLQCTSRRDKPDKGYHINVHLPRVPYLHPAINSGFVQFSTQYAMTASLKTGIIYFPYFSSKSVVSRKGYLSLLQVCLPIMSSYAFSSKVLLELG